MSLSRLQPLKKKILKTFLWICDSKFNIYWEYAEWNYAYTGHTQNEFWGVLTIHGTVQSGSREEWWLLGRSGGSLVATPDCKPTVLGSNPEDSPAYSWPPVLRWAAIWDGNFTVGCPLRAAEENINKKGLLVHQKQKGKKKLYRVQENSNISANSKRKN